ncbi:MAG TPA: AAA family ATPase [Clostridia bacterium]|nr:AAA family ATPase [Clostridia bacterium]
MRRKFTDRLLKWKNQVTDRMPMLVHGARQVGKTYAIKEFGREFYKNVIYVNFESDIGIAPYFDGNISPERIINVLEGYYHEKVMQSETLIFFDEIQACERALTSLKYFAEIAPEFHVIAAGSLLGVTINRSKFSFPVGKVFIEHLYPMDFEEFLWAKGKDLLASEIKVHYMENAAISEILHKEALNEYYDYLVTGGMPAAVKTHISKETSFSTEEVKNLILNSYISDMAKYAGSSESVKIKGAFDSLPAQLAKDNRKFQYKLIKTGARASLYGESIDWLITSGIVLKCVKCEHGFMPPVAYQDLSGFKLYMNDVGLLSSRTGVSLKSFAADEMNQYTGALAENYVACALAANGKELMYWESKSIAEVDFLIIEDGGVIPVEVKSSNHNRSKSLASYNEKYKPKYMIRISSRNFGFENNIKAVPLYSVFAIGEIE